MRCDTCIFCDNEADLPWRVAVEGSVWAPIKLSVRCDTCIFCDNEADLPWRVAVEGSVWAPIKLCEVWHLYILW